MTCLLEFACEVFELRSERRQLATHFVERCLELRDAIPPRLGRRDLDLRLRRRSRRRAGKELREADLLLSRLSRHLRHELARYQLTHDGLDVRRTREFGEAVRARLGFIQR